MKQFKCKAIKFTAWKMKACNRKWNEVVLRLSSSNMVGDNETNFPHKLVLTQR